MRTAGRLWQNPCAVAVKLGEHRHESPIVSIAAPCVIGEIFRMAGALQTSRLRPARQFGTPSPTADLAFMRRGPSAHHPGYGA